MHHVTWQQLQESLETAVSHPTDTAWTIYHYLSANYVELGSASSRALLASYIKLPVNRPSLLHSCILRTALKMADSFQDFRLPSFLTIWGFPKMLRQEDFERQTDAEGRTFSSLHQRTLRALSIYFQQHPECDKTQYQSLLSQVITPETQYSGVGESTTNIGREGEDMAAAYLQRMGYSILERNWHNKGRKELDIIALEGNTVVFVEVKTRKAYSLTSPFDAITAEKKHRLTLAADSYIRMNHLTFSCRFDVIGITGQGESARIEHIQNAFPPTNNRFY